MRLDRSITLNLVRPLRSLLGQRALRIGHPSAPSHSELGTRNSETVLPVLMYHSISDGNESRLAPYYRTRTSPAAFRQQMSWLKSAGYTGVTLSAGLSLLNSPTSTHDTRPVVLTFDDGYQDFYTTACPALHEFGFSATMFLATQFVGACSSATNPARPSFKGINCLNWREVRELHAAGFEFGSHTRSHPVLYQLDWPAIAAEIRDSKSEIESQLGAAVKTFAYPYAFPEHDGEFVAHLGALLREAGFSAGATTQIGRVHSSAQAFFIPRLPMNSDDDEMLIRAKLAGDYDWLRTPQAALKRLKHVLHPRRRLQDGPVADQPSAPTALTGPRA